jgi:hypothetical protein
MTFQTASQRAAEVGCSREAMYQQSRRVEQAVAREQMGGPSYDELCNENQRLRDENQALWTAWAATEALPESTQQEVGGHGLGDGVEPGPARHVVSHHLSLSRFLYGNPSCHLLNP